MSSFAFLCALPPEAAAAWAGLRRAGSTGRVSLVGMGPHRAKRAAARLASVLPDGLPVVVMGVGGALVGGFVPGELVVANAIGTAGSGADGSLAVTRPPAGLPARSSAFSDQVAAALAARYPCRQAAVLSAGRTVRGPERLSLGAASAAVLCDTESYWLSRLAERRPFAVVRSVVDSPERELVSLQTVTGGVTALRRLAGAAGVISSLLERQPEPVSP